MELAGLSIKHVASVIGLGLAFLLVGSAGYYLGTMTKRVCHNPSCPIQMTLNARSDFPINYQNAREEFTKAVADAGGRLESIQNPSMGPSGEALFMDFALFGNTNAKRVLVINSGTHGVEGFAGSAIQTKLLQEGIGSDLSSSVKLLMIHGINPYGMAHLRRFNEDNVDLNRNFVDHSLPKKTNKHYEELSDVIAPESISFWSEVKSWSRLLWLKSTAGEEKIKTAIEGGQYNYPKGLFYGGTSESWSNITIRTVLSRYLADVNQAIIVDIHTGLGEYGDAEIILNLPEESEEFRRASVIWDRSSVKSSVDGDSASTVTGGTLKLAFSNQQDSEIEITPASLEFGTLPAMEVFIALRAENWLHHYGDPDHPQAKRIKNSLLRAFHPGTQEWEDAVWGKGKTVIEKALLYLK